MSEDDYTASDLKSDDSKTRVPSGNLPHYYGDAVRKLFLVAGMIMLATLPFLREKVSAPVLASVVVILILTFAAGATNPKEKRVIAINIIISLAGFITFATEAISKFERVMDLLFATNIVLACIFLFAFYLSVKTLRGSYAFIDKAKKDYTNVKEMSHPRKEIPHPGPLGPRSEEDERKERFLHQDTSQ